MGGITTNYNTDLGSIFVSYADVQTLIQNQTPIASLVFTNMSTSVSSSINFYTTQTLPNNYTIQANTLVTLIVYSGYFINLTVGSGGNTNYYTGTFTITTTGTSSTSSLTINYIKVYDIVGKYWYRLFPTTATKTFKYATGTNINGINIVLAVSTETPKVYSRFYDDVFNNVLTTNIYYAVGGVLSELSFTGPLILSYTYPVGPYQLGDTTYNAQYGTPISISNDGTRIFYPLTVQKPTTSIYYVVPYILDCNISAGTTPITYGSGGGMTLGNATGNDFDVSFNNYSASTPKYMQYCQVQVYNGITFCMVSGQGSYLYVNNGTTTFTTPVTQQQETMCITMSETGQFQLLGSSVYIYYSNDYGATFTQGVISITPEQIQISSSSPYAICAAGQVNIYISQNFGISWVQVATATSATTSVSISSNGQYMIYTDFAGTYYSSDYGATFTLSSTYMANNAYIFPSEYPFAIACGQLGLASASTGFFYSN
jgi:hypothetical protein